MVNLKFGKKIPQTKEPDFKSLDDESTIGNNDLTDSARKVNIEKYKDPEGLTVQKMNIGLWFVENRHRLLYLLYAILIGISAVSWGIFFYAFGNYYIFGMKQDNQLADELTQTEMNAHAIVVEHQAQALRVGKIQALKLDDGSYDLLAEVTNPNDEHEAYFDYYFLAGGREIGRTSSFILPGRSKYLAALNQTIAGNGSDAQLRFNNISFLRIDKHIYPDWQSYYDKHIDFAFDNVKFTPAPSTLLTEKVNLNELQFDITNNSPYNYRDVELEILLYNQNRIIGINSYTATDLMSDEQRAIDITWPGRLATVDNIKISPEIDITRNDIYIPFTGKATGE